VTVRALFRLGIGAGRMDLAGESRMVGRGLAVRCGGRRDADASTEEVGVRGGRTQVTQFVVVRLARGGFADALNTHPMP
jgi:hypothetical protein